MSDTPVPPDRWRAADIAALLARLLLAGLFLYMGLTKALHPVEFLKLVRQYEVLHYPFALNLVAAALPWFEIFCALLLLAGIAVRGAAVMLVAMLIPFTVLILLRALALRDAGGLPLCAVKFDCGCGAGEVFACRKIAENIGLTVLALGLAFRRHHRLVLYPKAGSAGLPAGELKG
jgi:uncharacterized membrane protein YphA (DoxX/SURF4 family)